MRDERPGSPSVVSIDDDNNILKPRGSVRGMPHAWDADRAPEIQRIRQRTRALRKSRQSDTSASSPERRRENTASDMSLSQSSSLSSRTAQVPSSSSSSTTSTHHLALHDLCAEATTPDDVAWRNAVYLLSTQPHLAASTDPCHQQWTPLHVSCLAATPPEWWIRALLYVYPEAVALPDSAGRLPLHLAAASGGQVRLLGQLVGPPQLQLLEHCDDHGFTPLMVLLRNHMVQITVRHVQILLGLDVGAPQDDDASPTTTRLPKQRRQEHWNVSCHSRMLDKAPVTTNFLNHGAVAHEPWFVSAPPDVQVALRKLAQWKQHQVETSKSTTTRSSTTRSAPHQSPAAIATPQGQYPLHILVQRAIVDPVPLRIPDSLLEGQKSKVDEEDSNDDSPSENTLPSVVEAPSILRLLAAAAPQVLLTRDVDGLTPLLQVLVEENITDLEDYADILLGEEIDTAPATFTTPAMIPLRETGQLPLHIVAENHTSQLHLLRRLVAAYPASVQVADHCGRTPLHAALRAFGTAPWDDRVMEILLLRHSRRTTTTTRADVYGDRPVDLLLRTRLPRHAPPSTAGLFQGWWNEGDVVDVYKARRLPPWLRRQVCASRAIQERLVHDMAQPWKCAWCMADGLLLVALLMVFRWQWNDVFVGDDPLSSVWYTYAVYVCAVVRLCMQVLLGAAAMRLGEFQYLCLGNAWYWIDICAMLVSIVTSVTLYGDAPEDRVLTMATASTFLLWLALLGYSVNWWYGMAVFVGGVTQVRVDDYLCHWRG